MYPCNGGEYDYSGVYRGAIRTENGKTYQYQGGYVNLLMDFTLNVGDTMFSSICQDGKVIKSIDSVLVGDEYRKRFNFDDEWNYCNWMVEGVGHQRGLFESMDFPFESWSTFICYGENGIPIFGDGNCDITVGYAENKPSRNGIKIYPNPTYDNITIDISEPDVKIKSYLITDIYGKTLTNNKVEMGNNDLRINFEGYESGIYILIITLNDNKTLFKKIIKK